VRWAARAIMCAATGAVRKRKATTRRERTPASMVLKWTAAAARRQTTPRVPALVEAWRRV